LPGHAPFTVGLRDGGGNLRAIDNGEERVINVCGGFAKIVDNHVIILTEEACEA